MQRPHGDIGAHTYVPGSHAGVPHGQPTGKYNAWAPGRDGVTLRDAAWEMVRCLASVIDRPYRAIGALQGPGAHSIPAVPTWRSHYIPGESQEFYRPNKGLLHTRDAADDVCNIRS